MLSLNLKRHPSVPGLIEFFFLKFGFNLPNFTTLRGCPLKNWTFVQKLASYYRCYDIKNQDFCNFTLLSLIIQYSFVTVEPKHVSTLLSKFKKRSCLGSKCVAERGEEGFSENGTTPWIGYPTIVEVNLVSLAVKIFEHYKLNSIKIIT